ncbi:hypothetical protein [Herbaspirillum robiniae]|uniref:hypothetical protein n=1 Tax=Herbaspirillum robiniae TaxID=2014887 RepID=UPI0009A13B7E|nr:hypothetical protein [Herbaspirillum robiniae]
MSEDISQPRSRRIFDTTVNVQTLSAAIIGAVIALSAQWFGALDRIGKLESKDVANSERFGRIEQEQKQMRADSKDQVRGVQEQVTGVAGDVKEILRYLRDSSAPKRPELGRWSK